MLHLGSIQMPEGDTEWMLGFLARSLTTAAYRYTETVSKPKAAMKLTRLVINTSGAIGTHAAARALREGKAIGLGVNDARNLANLPGNICTPTYLARQARKLARENARVSVTVLEEKRMRELGMGALLSVSAGSEQPARLIVMHYKGGRASSNPYVLVGKGITFDTGGISLKPGAKMDEMKFDMGGAASVLGTLRAIAELELPLNVVGIVAAAENMPSGSATKPGDVVTSMSGQTIEVLNTDAEGRLILADALSYARKLNAKAIIDIATLTGSCRSTLGTFVSGAFSNNQPLADKLIAAGNEAGERAWQFPMFEEYGELIKSDIADIQNVGGKYAGAITAAKFLAEFVDDTPWVHMDIAGTSETDKDKGYQVKGATGNPVRTLVNLVLKMAGE
jgi:leucyl aminopeptidase